MLKYLLMPILVIGLLFGSTSAALAKENGDGAVDKITIRAGAERIVTADAAIVTLGVRIQDSSIKQAQQLVNDTMRSIAEALMANGVAEADIHTYGLMVSNSFRERQDKEVLYTVNNNIMVNVRNINELGKILDLAFEAGANQMSGISFTYKNKQAVQEQLFKELIGIGRRQAGLIVGADGRAVGRLMDVNVYTTSNVAPADANTMKAISMNTGAASMQVFKGDIIISTDANLVFEIK